MRIRSVKPEFWSHRMHKRISEPATLLALALLNFSDDKGRFVNDHDEMIRELFPRRPLSKPIAECLAELTAPGVEFIQLYTGVVDGEKMDLGCICTFCDHQVINKPKGSTLPPPPQKRPNSYTNTGRLPDTSDHEGGTRHTPENSSEHGALLTSMDRKGEEGKGMEGSGAPTRVVTFSPPTLQQVQDYAAMHAVISDCAEKWFYEQEKTNWEYYDKNPRHRWESGLKSFQVSWREIQHKKAPKNSDPTSATPGSVSSRSPKQARFELNRELQAVQSRLDAAYNMNTTPDPDDQRREKEIEAALKALDDAGGAE